MNYKEKVRIIPKLEIKNENLIKGIKFDGLRVIGDPVKFAKKYYEAGADQIIIHDIVASLYDRKNIYEIVKIRGYYWGRGEGVCIFPQICVKCWGYTPWIPS